MAQQVSGRGQDGRPAGPGHQVEADGEGDVDEGAVVLFVLLLQGQEQLGGPVAEADDGGTLEHCGTETAVTHLHAPPGRAEEPHSPVRMCAKAYRRVTFRAGCLGPKTSSRKAVRLHRTPRKQKAAMTLSSRTIWGFKQ